MRASSGTIGTQALAGLLVAHEVLEQSHESHRGGDLLLARAAACDLVGLVARQVERLVLGAARGDRPAELTTAGLQVLHDRGIILGHVERCVVDAAGLQLLVGDRDVQRVAQRLEVLEGELLHLVGRVAAREVLAEAVALDRVGEDHGGLALVLDRGLEGCVDLLRVVAAAVELPPDVVVREVLDEGLRAGIGVSRLELRISAQPQRCLRVTPVE